MFPNKKNVLKNIENFSSKSAINKPAYGGANFVPIAVPLTCLKVFFIEFKNVVFQHYLRDFYEGVTWDLFAICQFQKSSRRSQTFTCGMLG